MGTKKKLKEYWKKSVRKIRHRKGFGVHSPFAYNFITSVIEEKLPFYAYQRLGHLYNKNSVLSFKVATLLFRMANYFKVRSVAEIGCDGGFSILPVLLVDSRSHANTLSIDNSGETVPRHLGAFGISSDRVTFVDKLQDIQQEQLFDMLIINKMPDGVNPSQLLSWIFDHTGENTVIVLRGVRMGQDQEALWDELCDCDSIQITMDLFDYGLAMRRPRFFKQHYIVSF